MMLEQKRNTNMATRMHERGEKRHANVNDENTREEKKGRKQAKRKRQTRRRSTMYEKKKTDDKIRTTRRTKKLALSHPLRSSRTVDVDSR